MCAAPGSKTTQLAQLMKNSGVIVALDVKNDRLRVLRNNLERCGVENVLTYSKDARYVSDLGIKFDKVLLDAPCSGNFVIENDWFIKRELEGVVECSVVQKSLLKSALSVLKPGGVLVYSTCSLEPEEDELVIDWLLSNFKVELEEISLKIGSEGLVKVEKQVLSSELSKTRRFWPNLSKTQGFFVAKIRKL
jgi:NOL1/NOP2/sun family putative RNA methylase